MNATANVLKSSPGFRRVQTLSQILKVLLITYLVVLPLAVLAVSAVVAGPGLTAKDMAITFTPLSPAGKVVAAVSTGIYLLGAVVFYRLLNLYEAGIFFSHANVRLFRWLAYLAFSKGLLGVVAATVAAGGLVFPLMLLNLLGSPWVVGGLFGILISHIMDEGCKLQAEQELTV